MEEIVCLGNGSYFEIRAVPEELLAAVANAEGAQEDRFCERTGEVKIGVGRRTAFAVFQPLCVTAKCAGGRVSRPRRPAPSCACPCHQDRPSRNPTNHASGRERKRNDMAERERGQATGPNRERRAGTEYLAAARFPAPTKAAICRDG